MVGLFERIRQKLSGSSTAKPPVSVSFTESLARELCGFCTNGFVSGPVGSGRSSVLEPLARAILRRSGHAALIITVRREPLPGFEDNPWYVSLADGTGMDLADYLRGRPVQLARLELPGELLAHDATRTQLREALARVVSEALARRDPDPMQKRLSVLVDDAEYIFDRSAIDTFTAQSFSAAARFLWVVNAPWATLYANSTHRLFLRPSQALLEALPADVVEELVRQRLRPFELLYRSGPQRTGPGLQGFIEPGPEAESD